MNPVLAPGVLKRLARYQARLEGAQAALQAVQNVERAYQEQFREAVGSALEDAGISAPAGQWQLNIDWTSGEVSFLEPQEAPNGVAR